MNIIQNICAGLVGIALYVTGLYLFVDTPVDVKLVKTWSANEFTASSTVLDNGLYTAIERCTDIGGITGIEGSGKQHLYCYKDTTYIYADWKWVYWNF
jgi:hypothetical protein